MRAYQRKKILIFENQLKTHQKIGWKKNTTYRMSAHLSRKHISCVLHDVGGDRVECKNCAIEEDANKEVHLVSVWAREREKRRVRENGRESLCESSGQES